MEELNLENDTIVNYLLLVKNNYERLLNKNKEFVEQLCYSNKENPYSGIDTSHSPEL